jgi:hypothetical protein
MNKPRRNFWPLDPRLTFLNHGSFGSCPVPVREFQRELQDRMERQPVQFFVRDLEALLDAAREALAKFIGASPDSLVFVPNATAGINTVLRSLRFKPGDELLVTNHEYNACRNALDFVATRSRAKVVVAEIPFPIQSPRQVTDAVLGKVSARTRLVLLDHVTSQTGLVLPIAGIIARLNSLGVDTRAGRDVLHRQLSQMDLRAERRRVSLCSSRASKVGSTAFHQPWRQLQTLGSLALPHRIRLDRNVGPQRHAECPGGPEDDGLDPSRRLAGAHASQPANGLGRAAPHLQSAPDSAAVSR